MNENKEAGESARVVKFNPRYAMFASAGVDAVSLCLGCTYFISRGFGLFRPCGFQEKMLRRRKRMRIKARLVICKSRRSYTEEVVSRFIYSGGL
jgi:hypothetical protein